MNFTIEEKKKLLANVDAINDWINTYIFPGLRNNITVDFGDKFYSIWGDDVTTKYHLCLKADDHAILYAVRFGRYRFFSTEEYKQKIIASGKAHYSQETKDSRIECALPYVLNILGEWPRVKQQLLEQKAQQDRLYQSITNFTV